MNDSYCRNNPWLAARSLSGSFSLLQNALLVPLNVSSKNRFYLPNILLMRGRSALLISPSSAKRRFLLADFFSNSVIATFWELNFLTTRPTQSSTSGVCGLCISKRRMTHIFSLAEAQAAPEVTSILRHRSVQSKHMCFSLQACWSL